MNRIFLALVGALTWASAALAQPVSIVGPITPGNCTKFNSTTVLSDSGTPCNSGNIFASNNPWTGKNTFSNVGPGTVTIISPDFPPFLPAVAWDVSLARIGSVVTTSGTGPTDTITRGVALNITQVVPFIGAAFPPYEVDALLVSTRTSDPGIPFEKGVAALRGTATIAAGNLGGEVWGLFNQAIIEATGDGIAFGQETSIQNFGTSQPLMYTSTSKSNIHLTTEGNPTTVGMFFENAGPGWHKGIYAEPANFTGATGSQFIELLGKFTVGKTGFTAIGGTALTAHPLAVQAEAGGGFAIAIQGRASDGIGSLNWYANDLGTVYASLISNSSSELISSSTIAPGDNGVRNNGKATNAWLGVYARNVIINGSGSGAVTQTAQATAGTPNVTWGTASGTPAVTASSPLAITAATGNITCLTCVTSAASLTANQLVIGSGAQGEQTLGSLGTTTTVLHGNAGGAPTFGAVALADLATQATNTVLGNATAGPAVPTALAVGTCSTAASALIWTTNTGFGCNTSITAAAVAVGGITGLGTSVATALAVNVGTAGAFVVNGGALGSPSSAGTMPAFTLGGTVSGGGNQINNVIIGTTTPLAGTFTTFQANTSGAVGTGTGTPTMVVNGANSGTGGGAYISVQNAGGGVIALGNASAILGGAYDATGVIFTGAASFKAYVNGSYNFQVTNTQFAVLVTTDATSTSTGAMQIPGGMSVNKRVWMNGLTTSSASQTAYVCQASTGELIADTSAVNLCVASSERFKTPLVDISDGEALATVMKLQPAVGRYKPEGIFTSAEWQREHVWFSAEMVEKIDKRLVSYGPDGAVYSIDYTGVFTLYAGAIKSIKADNDNLRAEIEQLKRSVAR